MLKHMISKEVFKNYYGECKKIALAMADLDILKKMVELEKAQKLTFLKLGHLDDKVKRLDEPEDEDDITTAPLNPLTTFLKYYKENNEDGIYDHEIAELEALIDDNEDGEIDVVTNNIVDGNAFGDAVREYYTAHNFWLNKTENTKLGVSDFKTLSFNDSLVKTRDILAGPHETRYLFESAFTFENKLRIRPDVLEWRGHNRVAVFEAKASTYNETKTDGNYKRHYLDLAYQIYVLQKLGYVVEETGLVLINGDYCRGMEDVADFSFRATAESYKEVVKEDTLSYVDFVDLLNEVAKDGVPKPKQPNDLQFDKLVHVYQKNKNDILLTEILGLIIAEMDDLLAKIDAEISFVKTDDSIFANYFSNLEGCCNVAANRKTGIMSVTDKVCTNVFPFVDFERPHILLILGPSNAAGFILKYQKMYLDQLNMELLLTYSKNNKSESLFFKPHDLKKAELILKKYRHEDIQDYELLLDPEGVQAKLQDYIGPIYMYDFETSSWAIPQFDRHTSYDQTVFQYSIHVLDSNDDLATKKYHENHYAWLKKDQEDPRPEFIENFLRDAFRHGPGTYVSYNKGFEIGVLRKLATLFPKYRDPLLFICQNTIDLWDFFKFNMIYHPGFKRSTSIKYTQPTLYPALQYTDLVVNKGDKASFLFRQYIDNLLGEDSKRIWQEVHYGPMILYCNRDTEAMIVLYERLLEIVKSQEERGEQSEI